MGAFVDRPIPCTYNETRIPQKGEHHGEQSVFHVAADAGGRRARGQQCRLQQRARLLYDFRLGIFVQDVGAVLKHLLPCVILLSCGTHAAITCYKNCIVRKH